MAPLIINARMLAQAAQAFKNASTLPERWQILLKYSVLGIGFLMIILLVVILTMDPDQSPASPPPAPPPLSHVFKPSSISPSFDSSHPFHVLSIAIERTLTAVMISHDKIFGSLMTQQGLNLQEKHVLADCLEMLDQTQYELNQAVQEVQDLQEISFSSSSSLSLSSDFDDRFYIELKTLLSAAMTNENTCIEGIFYVEEANPINQKSLKKYLQDLLTPITHRISNCLAMVKHLENMKRMEHQNYMINKKIVMTKQYDDFLAWMTLGDWKMMQVVVPDIRPNFIVASDGSGDFRTIKEAVKMAPKMSRNRIFIKIKAGIYEENVEIPREKMNIMLAGEGMNSTVITSNNNFNSATLTVIGDRFLARDLTVVNTSGPKHQAVALRVTSNAAFYRCKFISYQETLHSHSLRQFYANAQFKEL